MERQEVQGGAQAARIHEGKQRTRTGMICTRTQNYQIAMGIVQDEPRRNEEETEKQAQDIPFASARIMPENPSVPGCTSGHSQQSTAAFLALVQQQTVDE
jgi:hypothetical protein